MVNINLKTKNTQKSAYESEANSNVGLIVLCLLAMIVIGIMIGFYFWKMSLTKEIKSIDSQISKETKNLSREETKKIMDFQNRLEVASEIVDNDSVLLAVFREFEKVTIPEVYINSVSYVDKKVSVTIVARDFTYLAKQIVSFKNSDFFKKVIVGGASVNSDGGVATTLTLNVD